VLSPASLLISLTLAFGPGSIEEEMQRDRIQEAQMRRQEEERRQEESLHEARIREEQERRALEERIREFRRQEEHDAEVRFQRDQDRRRREEIRAAELDLQRDEDERTAARVKQEGGRLNEFFRDGTQDPHPVPRVPPARGGTGPQPSEQKPKPPEKQNSDPIFEI
jgi:hypothetical protein